MNLRPTTQPALDSWFDQLQEMPEATPAPLPRPTHVAARELPVPDAGRDRPMDQADGLRKLFTGHTLRCIPVVSNPAIAFGGALLERLCTSYAEMGLHTLVIDAGERARAPRELAGFDLAEGIEPLSPRTSYLAARGLPLRFVDANGSTASFLDAIVEAAPQTDVLLVHAAASDLARLFGRRVQEQQAHALRPIVLCDTQAEAVTQAYASMKLLAQRAHLRAFDLLLSAVPDAARTSYIADSISRCADSFLGAALHDCVAVDPAECATDAPSAALCTLAREQLAVALPQHVSDSQFGALDTAHRSALPSLAARIHERRWTR